MVNMHLHIEPKQKPLTWNEFIKNKPPYSIALDGYVIGATNFVHTTKCLYVNFNHHEEVDRLSTRATCAQVLISIRQGLMDAFKSPYSDTDVHVYVNDCDQDVCLSWFLLHNSWMCLSAVNPAINRLVNMEDLMDTCAGAYPFPEDLPSIKNISWVFEPYTLFRMNGGVERKDENEFKMVINTVEDRINSYIIGKAGQVSIGGRYKKIGGGPNWSMVIENDFYARTTMMLDGIKAFVSCRKRNDDNYVYSIGRISHYIPFDIPAILQFLDKKENNSDEHWGGSNTIGGSPRISGSKFKPEEVEGIINEYISKNI